MELCTANDVIAALTNRTAAASPYQGGASFNPDNFHSLHVQGYQAHASSNFIHLRVDVRQAYWSNNIVYPGNPASHRYGYCCYNK